MDNVCATITMTHKNNLRLAFMGTPDFAVPALSALLESSHEILVVYSQPPKPAGRGHQVQKSPVHLLAETKAIPIRTPTSLRTTDEQDYFTNLGLDAAIVAAYGLILPEPILKAPRLGCLNIHASLLPRWRGAAPIQRAIAAGDTTSGITLMQMEKGLDTGPILLQQTCPITATMTSPQLHDQLSIMGATMIVDGLEGLESGSLKSVPQPENGVTYAAKLTREEGVIDWQEPAEVLERKIRAFQPWPGTSCTFGKEVIKILNATVVDAKSYPPGTLIDDELTVACRDKALRLLIVQRSGKKPVLGASFLHGQKYTLGQVI